MPDSSISYYHTGSNAALIVKVAELGYIKADDSVLDATVGVGTWWNLYRPTLLFTNDLDCKVDANFHEDFTAFPETWRDGWDVVCFDPPYRLNGTPDPNFDTRYGTHLVTTEAQVMATIRLGLEGCMAVVKPGGILLVKCQAQVCSGRVVWQDLEVIQWARWRQFELIDRFDMAPARPQPAGRRQLHARRGSTLLIFKRSK